MEIYQENTNSKRIFYYTKKADGSIRLLRCFGESPVVVVPGQIEGAVVSEIGSYCFAASRRLPKDYQIAMVGEPGASRVSSPELLGIAEQAGRFISRVILPDSICKVEAYAFYGCRLVREIEFGTGIRELENDAFMNCTGLKRLALRGNVNEPSALRSCLAQITWNIEVVFRGCSDGISAAGEEQSLTGKRAAFYFPEFYEMYEEIGPVHIFELQLSGEGFRARKAFAGECFRPTEYDSVFPKASVEEKPQIACRMALDRLICPVELTDEARSLYVTFLQKHAALAADMLCFPEEEEVAGVSKSELPVILERFFAEKIWGQETMEHLLQEAAARERAELTASLIGIKRRTLAPKMKKSRYSFDDF